MNFASDNISGVAPQIMAALTAANEGYAASYGGDALSKAVERRVQEVFEAPQARVFLVTTGTAANALSCAILAKPWETIFCHRTAHIEEDECGAPEFYTNGAKLSLIDGADGKIPAQGLEAALAQAAMGRGVVHHTQPGMVSLTNATECGTIYSVAEIEALCRVAHDRNVPVHLDGSRFANAIMRLGCSPAEMTWKAGVDVLSFGGTKNGCMGVEAVVVFDPETAWEFELRRKRAGHLLSKHRFLSAQMMAYLFDGLWLDLARDANAMADMLSEGIQSVAGGDLVFPTQANMVFARLPRELHQRAISAGAYYHFWPHDAPLEGDPDEVIGARLVCSWSTTPADVERFLSAIS
ncbi:low specificity L-threonine aldolase [Rhodobacteraceae bacterium]|nr:low specificity L-threonine aldolase [Paracoccaceae bacterium]